MIASATIKLFVFKVLKGQGCQLWIWKYLKLLWVEPEERGLGWGLRRGRGFSEMAHNPPSKVAIFSQGIDLRYLEISNHPRRSPAPAWRLATLQNSFFSLYFATAEASDPAASQFITARQRKL